MIQALGQIPKESGLHPHSKQGGDLENTEKQSKFQTIEKKKALKSCKWTFNIKTSLGNKTLINMLSILKIPHIYHQFIV